MKILAFDTAMAACSAAVVDPLLPEPLAAAFAPMERGQAEALAPMVAQVMAEARVDFGDIDRIAVTVGPGTFTGIRIGLALARGLGLARNIPVIGIDSLSAIAANETAARPVLVVADARNGEVYAAAFDAGRKLLMPPAVMTAENALAGLADDTMILGSAQLQVAACGGLSEDRMSRAEALPIASNFARLAASLAPGAMPSPLYLRAPDAKPQAAPLRPVGQLEFVAAGAEASVLLSEIHAECFDEGWDAKAFAALLATPGAKAELALEAGTVLGFVLTRQAADEAEIISIATRLSAQRRGVARQLLGHHLGILGLAGVRTMFLEVAAGNAAARGLYERLGFKEAGLRKGYYRTRGGVEDAIVMRRELAL